MAQKNPWEGRCPEVDVCEVSWRREGPCDCRLPDPPGGRKGLGTAGYLTHLEVSEVPGAVVILTTLAGEGGPKVHLDQLPVRAEADVAKDPEGRKEEDHLDPSVPGVQTQAPLY